MLGQAHKRKFKMKFDIIEVFTRAAKLIWKHKVLWIFGILASCGKGSGSNSNSSSRNNQFTDNQSSREMFRQLSAFAEKAISWFSENYWIVYVLVVLILIVWLIQIFIVNIGQIGLIRGAYHAETGVEKIKFGELFSESLGYFWRVIGIGLVIFLPVIVAVIVLFIAISFVFEAAPSSAGSGIGAVLLVIGLCCCFVPFMVALGLYYAQAVRALILEDLGIFAAIAQGWEVFRKNIGGLLAVAVILFFANLIIGIIIAIPVYIIVVPIVVSFLAGNITTWQPFIFAGIILLLYSPVAWFLNGILLTYTETIWTLIYIRVALPKNEAAPVMIEANA